MTTDPATSAKEPAGDFDYDRHGAGYASRRRADPRIAARVHAALGPARSVVNLGAGTGSYEPVDRYVAAVEPSASMRAQRAPHLAPAIRASAEQLPFDDGSFDAAMATLTIHQWGDARRGLAELRRVSRGPVVVLTFDPDALDRPWLSDYVPELVAHERRRFPPVAAVCASFGGAIDVESIAVPRDCVDGFAEAYTPGRSDFSTQRCGARSPHGPSSTSRRASVAWAVCGPTSSRERGTSGTGRIETRPSSKARFGSASRTRPIASAAGWSERTTFRRAICFHVGVVVNQPSPRRPVRRGAGEPLGQARQPALGANRRQSAA